MQYRGGQICDDESEGIAVGFMECSGQTSAADSLSKARTACLLLNSPGSHVSDRFSNDVGAVIVKSRNACDRP